MLLAKGRKITESDECTTLIMLTYLTNKLDADALMFQSLSSLLHIYIHLERKHLMSSCCILTKKHFITATVWQYYQFKNILQYYLYKADLSADTFVDLKHRCFTSSQSQSKSCTHIKTTLISHWTQLKRGSQNRLGYGREIQSQSIWVLLTCKLNDSTF